jgi:hypothetical protein
MVTLFYSAKSGSIVVGAIKLAVFFCLNPASMADELESYLWENRPLIIFADEINSPPFKQIMTYLGQRQCDIKDRQMVIGVLFRNGDSTIGDKRISSSYAESLWNRYQVGSQAFAVILIGKDGGEKYRLYEVPDLNEIFTLIDGMPMRQVEMEQSPSACGQK